MLPLPPPSSTMLPNHAEHGSPFRPPPPKKRKNKEEEAAAPIRDGGGDDHAKPEEEKEKAPNTTTAAVVVAAPKRPAGAMMPPTSFQAAILVRAADGFFPSTFWTHLAAREVEMTWDHTSPMRFILMTSYKRCTLRSMTRHLASFNSQNPMRACCITSVVAVIPMESTPAAEATPPPPSPPTTTSTTDTTPDAAAASGTPATATSNLIADRVYAARLNQDRIPYYIWRATKPIRAVPAPQASLPSSVVPPSPLLLTVQAQQQQKRKHDMDPSSTSLSATTSSSMSATANSLVINLNHTIHIPLPALREAMSGNGQF